MNSFVKTFLGAGFFFGLIMGVFFVLIAGLTIGAILGVVAGVFFGLFVALFARSQSETFTSERPLEPNEILIKEGAANHFLNNEAVGGWIYLTDKRLLFKSHSVNVQNHELSILLGEIVEAERGRTFGIVPNQLRLKLKNQTIEKFVVGGVGDWTKNIEKLR